MLGDTATSLCSAKLPLVAVAGDGGPVGRRDDHQQVAVLTVRGEHRPLLAHLAPVPGVSRYVT